MTYEHLGRMAELALAALHEPDPDLLWRSIAQEVLVALGGDLLVHKEEEWKPEVGRVRLWDPAERIGGEAISARLRREIRRCHPLLDHYLTFGDPTPVTASGAIGENRWRGTPLARNAREELDVRDTLAIPFPDMTQPLHGWIVLRVGAVFAPAEVDRARDVQPLVCGVERQCRTLRLLKDGIATGHRRTDPVRQAAELGLTPREIAVLGLLADTLTAAAIGRRLGISVRTAHTHIGNLYRKLNTADRLSTVLRAQTLGLLPAPPKATETPLPRS